MANTTATPEVLLTKRLLVLALALMLAPLAVAAPLPSEDAADTLACNASTRVDGSALDVLSADPVAEDVIADPGASYGGQTWCNGLGSYWCTYRWDSTEGCCFATFIRVGAYCPDRCI